MIDDFRKWVSEQNDFFSEHGLRVEIEETPKDVPNPSIRADFDSEFMTGRITVWNSGNCTMEVIDVATAAPRMNKHIQLEPDANPDAVFTEFFEALS